MAALGIPALWFLLFCQACRCRDERPADPGLAVRFAVRRRAAALGLSSAMYASIESRLRRAPSVHRISTLRLPMGQDLCVRRHASFFDLLQALLNLLELPFVQIQVLLNGGLHKVRLGASHCSSKAIKALLGCRLNPQAYRTCSCHRSHLQCFILCNLSHGGRPQPVTFSRFLRTASLQNLCRPAQVFR